MNVTHKFNLDLAMQGASQYINVMQNDKYTRNLEVNLYANGIAWEPPVGCYVVIRYSKSDGTAGEYNVLPNGSDAWSISENVVTVTLAPQVCTAKGVVTLAATLFTGTEEITTFTVLIYVRSHPNWNGSSEDYYGIACTDPTLSLSGMAADAKATGDAIASAEARISQLTKLQDGSTTGDAELADIRVGHNGSTYSTAGDAVREQVADLYSEVEYLLDSTLSRTSKTPYLLEADVSNYINPLNRWFFPVTLADVRLQSATLNILSSTVEAYIILELWRKDGNTLAKAKEWVFTIGVDDPAGYREFQLNEVITGEALLSVKPSNYKMVTIGAGSTMYKNSDMESNELSYSDLIEYPSDGLLGRITVCSEICKSEVKPKHLLIVGSNMEYETIQAAVDAAADGDTILVCPGEYREQVNALSKEIHIVGMDKNSCILIDSSANYYTPPLWMNIGSIENMTVIEDAADPDPNTPEGYLYWAYCIHVDGSTTAIGKQMRISNCILKNANRACLGMGTFANYSIVVENCDIYSGKHADNQPDRGAIYCHNSMDVAENQRVRFYNNRIECGGALTLCLINTFQESGDFTAEFINNMCWSAENGKTDESVQLYLDSSMKLAESSYGNNIACLNAQ